MSRLFRPLIEGIKGVIRHSANSLSSAIAVSITLAIVALFSIFTFNLRNFTKKIEQSVQISVMVDYDYESAEEEGRISLAIQEIEGVSEVTYSSKAEEFQYYLDSFTDEATKEAFAPFEEDNPMHDAYYVTVEDGSQLETVAQEIQAIEGVDEVNFGGTSAVSLISMLQSIRSGGYILALALSVLAIFLIQNTINLTIQSRAAEIAIMRTVGAKNGFIRSPFLIEGILIGALGALLPMAGTIYGYRYLYALTGGYVISQMFQLLPPTPFSTYVALGLLAIGALVGLIGSFLSVTRYLRWKR